MCKGLAVIAEKIDDEWKVYAKQGQSSHDELLHELRDDLKYGKALHLKFEVLFPNRVQDDIQQECEYPEGWIIVQWGKKVACKDAFLAVFKHLNEHPELLEFLPYMLQEANLSKADLSKANLSKADLSKANLSKADLRNANLRWADLRWADLSEADLRNADLSKANLSNANLRWADLRNANLSEADLSEAKTKGTLFPEDYEVKK